MGKAWVEGDVTEVSVLQEGERLFLSTGYSYVKVTNNGQDQLLKLPIKSEGITELVERFQHEEPRPPVKRIRVEPDSLEGRAIGLRTAQMVDVFDFTDEQYLKQKREHEHKLGLAMVLHGLNVTFKDKSGDVVKDDDKKLSILKEMGMSVEQFQTIINDIRNLTKIEEERGLDF